MHRRDVLRFVRVLTLSNWENVEEMQMILFRLAVTQFAKGRTALQGNKSTGLEFRACSALLTEQCENIHGNENEVVLTQKGFPFEFVQLSHCCNVLFFRLKFLPNHEDSVRGQWR